MGTSPSEFGVGNGMSQPKAQIQILKLYDNSGCAIRFSNRQISLFTAIQVNRPKKISKLFITLFTLSPVGGAKYCKQRFCMSIYLFVCLSYSPIASLKTTLPLFLDDVGLFIFLYNGGNRPESKTKRIFVQFATRRNQLDIRQRLVEIARWRHRGKVCHIRLHLVLIVIRVGIFKMCILLSECFYNT